MFFFRSLFVAFSSSISMAEMRVTRETQGNGRNSVGNNHQEGQSEHVNGLNEGFEVVEDVVGDLELEKGNTIGMIVVGMMLVVESHGLIGDGMICSQVTGGLKMGWQFRTQLLL